VQRWLADDNHAEEKKEALHTLWQQAVINFFLYTLNTTKRKTLLKGK